MPHRAGAAVAGVGAVATALVWLPRILSSHPPSPPPAVLQQQIAEDTTPEKRVAAARSLALQGPRAREEIRQSLAANRDAPPDVRAALLQGAMKARDWRSLPEILLAMEDEDVWVRGRAGAAAQEIMGVDFGFRAHDPPAKRAEVLRLIRREYEGSQGLYQRFYRGQEGGP